jgi:hypothetical protein
MRKRCRRKHWNLLNPVALVAENNSPVPEANNLILGMWEALNALQFGDGGKAHWDKLAEVYNHGRILAKEFGLGPEHLDAFRQGQAALLALADRAVRGGKFTLFAQELAAIRDMCQVHDLQLQSVTVKQLAHAAARVHELKRSAPTFKPQRVSA